LVSSISLACFLCISLISCGNVYAGFRNSKIRVGKSLLPKKFALIIGIQRSTKSPVWPTLRFAKRDARRMTRALSKVAKFDRILTLTRTEDTTTASILRAFRKLKSWVKHPKDTVLVYFSAHGTVGKGRNRYIITSDTSQKIPSTALSVKVVMRLLQGISSRRIGLILAMCYTGLIRSKSVLPKGVKGVVKPRPFRKRQALQILSAASYAQPAFESDVLRADVYTHFFLDCFIRQRYRTIIDIHVCAARQTTPYVKRLNGDVQVPKAYSAPGANRDFFLLAQKDNSKKRGYLRTAWRSGQQWSFRISRVALKGPSEKIIRLSSQELTALEPGKYRVAIHDAFGKLRRIQTVQVGEERVVELLSDWTFALQANGVLSTKGGTDSLWGGSMGMYHRFFGWKLGLSQTSKTYLTSAPSLQLLPELRLEGGMRFEWLHFDWFLGGYGSTGLLFSHVGHPKRALGMSLLFGIGATTSVRFWLFERMALVVQGDLGMSLFRARNVSLNVPSEPQWQPSLEGGLHLGIHIRL